MKIYNQTNFFKHTFCEFQQVDDFEFPENRNYKSKSESLYFYTDEGVYRKSNHWGRVANCRWKLIANKKYKNQQIVVGFAKWVDFCPINSTEKNFFIDVDFEMGKVKIQPQKENRIACLFSFSEAQKRVKQIKYLLENDKWAAYFDQDIAVLRRKVILAFINSDKSLLEIKQENK